MLLDDILLAKTELGQLEQAANVVRSAAKDRAAFIEEAQATKPDALYRHFGGAKSIKVSRLLQ